MGHPAFRVVADDDLEPAILTYIGQLKRRKVVPTNRIVKALKGDFPDAGLSDELLASLVKRVAISLDLVPVFDPELPHPSRSIIALHHSRPPRRSPAGHPQPSNS